MRRHVRVRHQGWVECETPDGEVFARSVDISASGMMLELPRAAEPQAVQFRLPGVRDELRLPVKPLRSAPNPRSEVHRVALRFNFPSERERSVLQQFVRDSFSRAESDGGTPDVRKLPRVACRIVPVECERDDLEIESIRQISTEGLQIRFSGALSTAESLRLGFQLPGDRRTITLEAAVVHVRAERFAEYSTAGLAIERINEVHAARLRNFVVDQSSGVALRVAYERLAARPDHDSEFRLEPEEIARVLERARSKQAELRIIGQDRERVIETRLLSETHTLTVRCDESDDTLLTGTEETDDTAVGLIVGLNLDGENYFFRSRVSSRDGDSVELSSPREVFRSEKRGQGRDQPGAQDTVVEIELLDLPGKRFSGRVVDASSRGMRCLLELKGAFEELSGFLRIGASLRYDRGEGSRIGEIRHTTAEASESGTRVVIGIECGVEREASAVKRIDASAWEQLKNSSRTAPLGEAAQSRAVTYYDREGRPIKALVNATAFGGEALVVILPPAFGKKKEATAPLAAVLTATFARHGREVVTIRYDGIDRPGESYSSVADGSREYDMLRFRVSQSLSDLQATIDFAYGTDLFTPTGVVPVTFSMAALEGRKAALDPRNRERIVFWVSVMGVAAGQPALVNTLGGIDPVGNYKLGVPIGVAGLLGHLVNLDAIAGDLIRHGLATVSDARADMGEIEAPVLWIYGEHDKWVTSDDVLDIMSIAAPAAREVIRVPAGHNLRTSDDAIATFALIASRIFATVHREEVEALKPDREELLELITRERERLDHHETLDAPRYWERYLIGEGSAGSGYDVYRNIDPFRRFLDREVELAAVGAGTRVADVGCGTGLFLERLVAQLAVRRPKTPVTITAIDLVPSALQSAAAKLEGVAAAIVSESGEEDACPWRTEFRVVDLEPSRFIPFQRLHENPELGGEYLRGRVEGLTNVMLDRLLSEAPRELEAALQGSPLSDDLYRNVGERNGNDAAGVLRELSLAARAVCGQLAPEETGGGLSISPGEPLRAEQLEFRMLNLGRGLVLPPQGFADAAFDVVVASLFISYLFNPEYAIEELWRILAPGGRLVISSMRPDSDISTIFTEYVSDLGTPTTGAGDSAQALEYAREMLNEAAGLFELEEDGYFRFYSADELAALLLRAGFQVVQRESALGNPPQAVIVVGVKP